MMVNALYRSCREGACSSSKLALSSFGSSDVSGAYLLKNQAFLCCYVCRISARLLKKTLTMVLIFQLSFPTSFVMAMETGDEETFRNRRPSMRHSEDVFVPQAPVQIPVLNPLTVKLQDLYVKSKKMLPKLIDDLSIASQSMDDYYVNLQIVVDKSQEGEKYPIELTQLFDDVENQHASGKVLIVGGAGIGKTTLLDRIAYEWGKGKLFQDKFDYVFTVRLKKLTTDAWRNRPTDMDDPLETLMCESLCDQAFTHRDTLAGSSWAKGSLLKQDKAEIVSLLTDKEKRSRVLLLLDGYDEVAKPCC
jgi:hypothetical protein